MIHDPATSSFNDVASNVQLIPRTMAVRRALMQRGDCNSTADLLFLEEWEVQPRREVAVTLRAHQIRRANPTLAAEIRAELQRGRPLTKPERDALTGG
jgi:hypothetical protein